MIDLWVVGAVLTPATLLAGALAWPRGAREKRRPRVERPAPTPAPVRTVDPSELSDRYVDQMWDVMVTLARAEDYRAAQADAAARGSS